MYVNIVLLTSRITVLQCGEWTSKHHNKTTSLTLWTSSRFHRKSQVENYLRSLYKTKQGESRKHTKQLKKKSSINTRCPRTFKYSRTHSNFTLVYLENEMHLRISPWYLPHLKFHLIPGHCTWWKQIVKLSYLLKL